MRRCLFAIIPFAAIAVACSSRDANDADDNATSEIEVDSFYSPDLAFADLRGPVRQSVVVSTALEQSADTLKAADDDLSSALTLDFSHDGYIVTVAQTDSFMDQVVGESLLSFEFDPVGNLVSSSTDYNGRFMVKRDKSGYVTTFTGIGANGDVDYTKVYTWDNGMLSSEQMAADRRLTDDDGNAIAMPVDKATYKYDDKGYRISGLEQSGDPQLKVNVTETTYIYTDYDSHGNWTARQVTRIAKVYDVTPAGRRNLADSVAAYAAETRTISYYE